jgi:drug/metabolite transporter (DMT)-like permease
MSTPLNPPHAVAFMVTATLFIAGSMLMAKLLGTDTLGEPLHPLQISHGRFLFAFLIIGTVTALRRPRFAAGILPLHVARTICGWAGVSLMFAAVAYIPMSDATAISFLNPVFGMMLAVPLLGETVGRIRWSAAVIALAGALILLRPTVDSFQPASLLALGAAMVLGMELILIKKLSARDRPLAILFVNNALGLIIASLAVIAVWQPPTGAQWLALVGVGGTMACAQACFVNAMARADASFVTPFSYLTLVVAAGYDFAVFGQRPDAISILGAGVIVAGAALLAWREARRARRPA